METPCASFDGVGPHEPTLVAVDGIDDFSFQFHADVELRRLQRCADLLPGYLSDARCLFELLLRHRDETLDVLHVDCPECLADASVDAFDLVEIELKELEDGDVRRVAVGCDGHDGAAGDLERDGRLDASSHDCSCARVFPREERGKLRQKRSNCLSYSIMIPSSVTILHDELPDNPGVYFYYDIVGMLLYIGKATSLKKRVGSYFTKAHDARIGELVSRIATIEYIETPTVIEALVLESNSIRKHQPPYNVASKDDKSFLYLCITKEAFPKPMLLRGLDLEKLGIQPFQKTLSKEAKKQFLAVFGPYIQGRSLRTALDLIRKSIPWSRCEPNGRACFDSQIGLCPGVCTGAISKEDYRKIVKQLIQFFEGKKEKIVKQMRKEMNAAARSKDFEGAVILRNKIFALEHIQDVALITRDDAQLAQGVPTDRSSGTPRSLATSRIEAYDIAHIGGTSTVASMVVFEDGVAKRDAYRKFKIKSFEGTDDVAAMEEVMRRRLARAKTDPTTWPLPMVLVIDGGEGQVNRVREVVAEFGLSIPIIGIAKGFDRKQDRLVYDRSDEATVTIAKTMKETMQKARDEAHRFAGAYHRVLRSKASGIPKRKKNS